MTRLTSLITKCAIAILICTLFIVKKKKDSSSHSTWQHLSKLLPSKWTEERNQGWIQKWDSCSSSSDPWCYTAKTGDPKFWQRPYWNMDQAHGECLHPSKHHIHSGEVCVPGVKISSQLQSKSRRIPLRRCNSSQLDIFSQLTGSHEKRFLFNDWNFLLWSRYSHQNGTNR